MRKISIKSPDRLTASKSSHSDITTCNYKNDLTPRNEKVCGSNPHAGSSKKQLKDSPIKDHSHQAGGFFIAQNKTKALQIPVKTANDACTLITFCQLNGYLFC